MGIGLKRVTRVAAVREYQTAPVDQQRLLVEPRQNARLPSGVSQMKQMPGVIKAPVAFNSRGCQPTCGGAFLEHTVLDPQPLQFQRGAHPCQSRADHGDRAMTR